MAAVTRPSVTQFTLPVLILTLMYIRTVCLWGTVALSVRWICACGWFGVGVPLYHFGYVCSVTVLQGEPWCCLHCAVAMRQNLILVSVYFSYNCIFFFQGIKPVQFSRYGHLLWAGLSWGRIPKGRDILHPCTLVLVPNRPPIQCL